MIARLIGEVVAINNQVIVLDVHGVGYEVTLSANDLLDLRVGSATTLFTHQHIRENSQELFGFKQEDTKSLFELLISVSGVGPKMAMSILNLGECDEIKKAIASANVNYLSGANGVGKRLAERVTVDLKDKVGVIAGKVMAPSASSSGDEALDALVALGYSHAQSAQVLAKVDANADTQTRVKQALKLL